MAQSFVDEFIPRIEQLKNCRSLGDLAHILGYKPQALSYILYKIPDESKYSEFEIPKKSGGVRKIQAPTSRLKKLQRRLANLLSDCEEELFESQIKSEGDKKRYSRTGSHVLKLDEQYLMAIKRDYRFQPMLNCMSVNDTYLTLI